MRSVYLKIGSIVREYRIKSDMTQLELSRKLGYETPQFVSLFERGLSKVPLNVIGKLVVILGIPERKLMDALIAEYETNLRNEINQGKKSV